MIDNMSALSKEGCCDNCPLVQIVNKLIDRLPLAHIEPVFLPGIGDPAHPPVPFTPYVGDPPNDRSLATKDVPPYNYCR